MRTTPFGWMEGGGRGRCFSPFKPFFKAIRNAHHQKSNDSGINPPWDDKVGGGGGWEGGEGRC